MNICFPVQSFKGTLEAIDAYKIAKSIIKNADIFPISDGGDGFLDIIDYIYKKGIFFKVKTINAEGENIFARVYKYKNNFYIESANIIGLKRIKGNKSVYKRSTRGLGIVLKKIYNNKNNYYIGLGGSATIDIGGEMLEELNFYVEYYKNTKIAKRIRINKKYNNIFIIPDVENPLNGRKGAIIYAKQKGVRNTKILLEKFNDFSKIHSIENIKYTGAAGGLGAVFYLMGAKFINNFEFFNKLQNIKNRINKSDTIIICEGHFDNQSFNGKINGEIVKYALKKRKKIFIISGKSNLNNKNIYIIELDKNSIKRPKYYFRKSLLYLKNNYIIVKK